MRSSSNPEQAFYVAHSRGAFTIRWTLTTCGELWRIPYYVTQAEIVGDQMSVDLGRESVPTAGVGGEPPVVRSGRTSATGKVVMSLVGLVVGVIVGVGAALGAVALFQQPQSTLPEAARAIPGFAQPQTRADAIPTGITGFDPSSIVAGSSRLAGRTPTASYYLSVATDGRVCLLILPADRSKPWAQGCSARLPFSVAAGGSGSARATTSDSTAPAGTIRMGLNVIVDPDSASLVE